MAGRDEMRHLTSEQIQEFLDRALTPREEAAVQAHLSVCPHCQEELEAWGLLFSDLSDLEELAPGPEFSRGILARLPSQQPMAARVRGWLGSEEGSDSLEQHIPVERIQDYLEGALPRREAKRAQEHLAACEPCQEELRGWQGLFSSLGALRHFSPAPGFARSVMARVRIPAPLPVPWTLAGNRVMDWARGFLPQTRKGWAVAGGIASAPTITVVALFYLVFSHPLLTAGSFVTYVSWKVSALFSTLFSAVVDAAMGSATLFRAYTAFLAMAESPLLVGIGGLVFSLLSGLALWVLYRNLVATRTPERRYARARL